MNPTYSSCKFPTLLNKPPLCSPLSKSTRSTVSSHCSRWTCTPNDMRAFLSRIVATLCLPGARLDLIFQDPLGFHWETISVQTLLVTVTGLNICPLHAAQGSHRLLDSGSCFT